MRMDEMTSDAFRDAVRDGAAVILPFGGTEAHGHHLPLGTDSFQPERVAELVSEATGSLIAPTMPYAHHSSMKRVPGTVAMSFGTVRSFTRDFLDSMERHGVRMTAIVCGHAGASHLAAVSEACRSFKEDGGRMKVIAVCDYIIGEECPMDIPEGDGHAGMAETSRIMDIRPELVKEGRHTGRLTGSDGIVLDDGSVRFEGLMQGDTATSAPEKGEELNRFIADRIVRIMGEADHGQ